MEKVTTGVLVGRFQVDELHEVGGGLLRKVNRDDQRCAIKCSAQKRSGVWYDIKKLTYGKESKAGRFLELDLPIVFENGELVRRYTFDEVRANAAI